MSIEQYSDLTDSIEERLDEADMQAEKADKCLSHDEVFNNVRGRLNKKLSPVS